MGFRFPDAWQSNLPVTGCGKDTVINLMFGVSKADGKIKTLVLAPGTTATSALLQRDAFRYAAEGFRSRVKDCATPIVINTHFESYGVKDPPMAIQDLRQDKSALGGRLGP